MEIAQAGHEIQPGKMVTNFGQKMAKFCQNKQKSSMNFRKKTKFEKLIRILSKYCIIYSILVGFKPRIDLGYHFYQVP